MSLVPFSAEQARPVPATTVAQTGNNWVDMVAPAAELAKMIANTDFVPQAMRNNPAAITACVLYGAEVGIGPMQALSKVDIVKGRPAPRAELARALAFAAGHDIWVDVQTDTKVTVKGRRANSTHEHTITWTMDDAKRAGLANSNTYRAYPQQMLLARATAQLVRQMCPDVLGGVSVFAEEAETIDEERATVVAKAAESAPRKRQRKSVKPAEPEPVEATIEPANDDGEPMMTEPQKRKLFALQGEHGITDRDDRITYCSDVIGRKIASSNDLTKADAAKIIDELERHAIEQMPPLPDEEPSNG